MHSNSIGCPKMCSLSAPVLYWLSHRTCISSLKAKNERKTLIFTQLEISRYKQHFFSLFLDEFLETDLRPIYCSPTTVASYAFYTGWHAMDNTLYVIIFWHAAHYGKISCCLYEVVPKGLLSFLGFFVQCGVRSLLSTSGIYPGTYSLGLFAGLFSDAMGYCLPIVS